jgi:hypothetical protein
MFLKIAKSILRYFYGMQIRNLKKYEVRQRSRGLLFKANPGKNSRPHLNQWLSAVAYTCCPAMQQSITRKSMAQLART